MKKAMIALVITLILGILFAIIGHENNFTELGSVVAIAVMGGFIIYFNEKRKDKS